jgi:hypothetical protein
MQRRGIPTVTLITTAFKGPAETMARGHGYPEIPHVIIPHPFLTLPHAEVIRIAEESFPKAMAALLRKSAEVQSSVVGRPR